MPATPSAPGSLLYSLALLAGCRLGCASLLPGRCCSLSRPQLQGGLVEALLRMVEGLRACRHQIERGRGSEGQNRKPIKPPHPHPS